jgi:hypothetical protein
MNAIIRVSRRIAALILALLLLAIGQSIAAQGTSKKVALVIGNSSYQKIARLPNPANDASDMATALGKLGFEIIKVVDGTQAQMDDAVESFRIKLAGAEAGLFYYAGHGVQSQGANYLIPVDAAISAEYQLRSKALDSSMVLEAMSASGCPLNIVVLDACRDNPFAAVRSMSRGLSVMSTAPTGAIIIYATDPGKAAQDGSGRNGVFTEALLRHIAEPGIDVKAMFDRVGADVAKATGNAQNPWISSKFYGTYSLSGGGMPASASALSSTATAPAPAQRTQAPTLSVTRAYGSLSISVQAAGTLYLDGAAMGTVPVGGQAKLESIEVGDHSLEVRYVDGKTEPKRAAVRDGEVANVVFAYKPRVVPPLICVGYYQEGLMGNPIACYWRRDKRVDLAVPAGAWRSEARAVAIAGDMVLVAGQSKWFQCYWENNRIIELALPKESEGSIAYAVTVCNDTTYVGGAYEYFDMAKKKYFYVLCYWANGRRVDFPAQEGQVIPVRLQSFAVHENRVYMVANSKCWRDGQVVDLSVPQSAVIGGISALASSGGSLYILGTYNSTTKKTNTACYWENGQRTDLPVPENATYSSVSSIAFSGNQVYVLGRYLDDAKNYVDCYWRNGQLVKISKDAYPVPAGARCSISSITVLDDSICLIGKFSTDKVETACCWMDGMRTDYFALAGMSTYITGFEVLPK